MRTDYVKHKITNIINIQKIVTLHYFELDCNFHYKEECHDFWELVYVDKGDLQVTASGNDFVLKQGECYFHKPKEVHLHSANGIVAPNIFIISFVCHSESMKFFKQKKIRIPANLRYLISNIVKEGQNTFELPFNDPGMKELKLLPCGIVGGQQMIRTYLEQLLILLLRCECDADGTDAFSSRQVMMEHIADRMIKRLDATAYQHISVDKFCREMKYSRAYLSKIFMSNCGCSINSYITKVKINEAKKLIREHTYNFSQISDMLCFSNPLYFSRVFRRTTGMSPTEYRKSVKID